MATENLVRLLGSGGDETQTWSGGLRHSASSSADMAEEQDRRNMIRGEKFHSSRQMFPNRSGSAPPTFEGSLAALGGLFPNYVSGPNSTWESQTEKGNAEGVTFGSGASPSSCYSRNQNPRLPKDFQRFGHHVGGMGDRRMLRSFDDSNSSSLFLSRPLLPTHKEEPEEERSPVSNLIRQGSSDWADRGFEYFSGSSLGSRPKSLVDLIQEDFPRTPSPVYSLSRSAIHTANEGADSNSSVDTSLLQLTESSLSSAKVTELKDGSEISHTISATSNSMHTVGAGSIDSSSLPVAVSAGEPGETKLSESTNIAAGGSNVNPELDTVILSSANTSDASKLVDAFQSFNMSDMQGINNLSQLKQHEAPEGEGNSHCIQISSQHQGQQKVHLTGRQGEDQFQGSAQALYQHYYQIPHNQPKPNLSSNFIQTLPMAVQSTFQPVVSTNPHLYATAAAAYMTSGNPYYQNIQPAALFAPQYSIGGYNINPTLISPLMSGYPAQGAMPVAFDNAAAALAANVNSRSVNTAGGIEMGADIQNFYKFGGQFGTTLQTHNTDPMQMHFLQRSVEDSYNVSMLSDPLSVRGFIGGGLGNNMEFHKASMVGYAAQQKSQFVRSGNLGIPLVSRAVPNPAFYGSSSNMGFLMQYPSSSLASPLSSGSSAMVASIPGRLTDQSIRFPMVTNKIASVGSYSGWQSQSASDKLSDIKCSSFLEELKNNRTRRFELSDIIGHVVEFSGDQHGSRFIQQKLESASPEDKELVFQEVLPHASKLMTDVFGNYVIQKFFEHGSGQQRKELAHQLSGRILSLSLQMYGCRVVQKALEVVDVDQQMQLVSELDGHVIKCVRDQNGNHVIQKCIECVPTEQIEFIISAFYGQVVTLSTHPYGCRVIQRILEHCTEDQKNNGIMEEILEFICSLAEDQYGNYVAQHVLEHGRPKERSIIIQKLFGKVVQMSQHKFASNVVEKCLEYGNSKERELLIDEMLGDSEEHENLQAMMKDPFANYVIQKVLETCNDLQRQKLLACIRENSNALKKYTYGKHIVARAEKLISLEEKPLE